MLKKLYTVYDVKTQYHNPPVACFNDHDAMRQFATILQGRPTIFQQYPEDFWIFEVGQFDDSSGEVKALSKMNKLCTLADLRDRLEGKEKNEDNTSALGSDTKSD